MKIYLIVCRNRHTDVEIFPRRDKNQANEEARALALENCSHPDYFEETIVGGLYSAAYNESDRVYVVEAELE